MKLPVLLMLATLWLTQPALAADADCPDLLRKATRPADFPYMNKVIALMGPKLRKILMQKALSMSAFGGVSNWGPQDAEWLEAQGVVSQTLDGFEAQNGPIIGFDMNAATLAFCGGLQPSDVGGFARWLAAPKEQRVRRLVDAYVAPFILAAIKADFPGDADIAAFEQETRNATREMLKDPALLAVFEGLGKAPDSPLAFTQRFDGERWKIIGSAAVEGSRPKMVLAGQSLMLQQGRVSELYKKFLDRKRTEAARQE